MPTSPLNLRVDQDLKAKLLQEASSRGVDLSTIVKEKLEAPSEIAISGQPASARTYLEKKVDPLDDYVMTLKKMAVARMFQNLATSSMMSPEEQLQRFGRAPKWIEPQKPPEQKVEFTTKDMMDRLTILKMIEGMEKKTTDPEMKSFFKEMREFQEKSFEELKKAREEKKDEPNIKELMQWITFYRMAGQPEEAKKYEKVLNDQVSKFTKELYDTKLEMIRQQGEWRTKELERQIMEIKNRPSEFDQITQISQLSHQDPAIKAYLHKKLGIEPKGELTPEKLKGYIESIKVPVGDILKGLYSFVQQRAKAPQEMPPPPTRELSEEEVARKALPPEVLEQPPPSEPLPPEETPLPSPVPDPKTIAREMLLEHKTIDDIVKKTGLTPAQIRGMKGGLTKSGILEKEGSE